MSFWNGKEWVADAPPVPAAPVAKPASRVKRLAAAALEASLITALTFGLIAGTAFAGKGGGGRGGHGGGGSTITGGGTISLAPIVVDNNGNGLPDYTDVVTFDASTTATTTPYVNLVCTQNGVLALSSWKGYWAGSLDTNWNFGLESGGWPGGAADCTAYLKMQTKQGWSILASTSFTAGG
jgi:hypothetical protein